MSQGCLAVPQRCVSDSFQTEAKSSQLFGNGEVEIFLQKAQTNLQTHAATIHRVFSTQPLMAPLKFSSRPDENSSICCQGSTKRHTAQTSCRRDGQTSLRFCFSIQSPARSTASPDLQSSNLHCNQTK